MGQELVAKVGSECCDEALIGRFYEIENEAENVGSSSGIHLYGLEFGFKHHPLG